MTSRASPDAKYSYLDVMRVLVEVLSETLGEPNGSKMLLEFETFAAPTVTAKYPSFAEKRHTEAEFAKTVAYLRSAPTIALWDIITRMASNVSNEELQKILDHPTTN